MKHKVRRIHFVGIGGSGMSGIAEVLINLGYGVSGSDLAENAATRRLRGAWPGIAAFALGVVALCAFRYGLFGHFLPLSYHAKPAVLGEGLRYVARLAEQTSADQPSISATAPRTGSRTSRATGSSGTTT